VEPATGSGRGVAEVVGDRVRAIDGAHGERTDERDLGLDLLDPPAYSGGEASGLGHLALESLAVHLQGSLLSSTIWPPRTTSASICATRSVVSRTLAASTASRRFISVRNDIREAASAADVAVST
jgi:hypothetical protein